MLYKTKNPHGGDVYENKIVLDYSANTNPYGTPQGVIDAMTAAMPDVHQYPDPYCRKLIAAIAEYENVPEEYILCGNGAAELIYSYFEATKPKCAVELAPTFSEYSLGMEKVGTRVERYALKQENNFMLDEGFFDFAAEVKPEVIVLCNPNNPTGQLIPQDMLKRILSYCKDNNVLFFLDECFMDLTGSGQSISAELANNPNLFILKAFTKSFGMAGVRLGYCLCADANTLSKMAEASQPWNISLLAQAAGVAALKEKEFLAKTVATVKEERPILAKGLSDLGFWVCPGEANYIFFKGPECLQEKLKDVNIAIRDCSNYYGLTKGWHRVAVRLRHQNEALLDAMSKAIGGK